METVNAVEEIINWCSNVETKEKVEFIKRFWSCFDEEELKLVSNTLGNERKRRRRRKAGSKKARTAELTVTAVEADGPKGAESHLVAAPQPKAAKGWFKNWRKNQIFAIDCEMVSVPIINENGKRQRYELKAAIIAVVGFDFTYSRKWIVKWEPGSFNDNWHWRRITGCDRYSFKNGIPLEKVQEEIDQLFEDKLIIGWALHGDFSCIGLNIQEYATFDLQKYWWRWVNDNECGLKLKVVYDHYFPGSNFQNGAHCALADAKATMQLFHKYIEEVNDAHTIRPLSFIGNGFDNF